MARQIDIIIVHCSDSTWGNAEVINQWHLQNGWSGIGYHGVILNGHPTSHGDYDPTLDGFIESGRSLEVVGAHCKGYNSRSVGLCLIGKDFFTDMQMEVLYQKLAELLKLYGLDPDAIYGHYEMDDHKTCPNLDMDEVRARLWEMWS
ncbi:N-acetylmuramoyl-L-alanine amidase [Maridesulfovibrio ferrireducens]|uniref:N-acetylmuramoyl-L-alanine amidase n=1 Tax=Maridesulfovibrio ferrireducens TaxID=246191 RepID=UPI0026EDE1CB|nr:N-acetylmuramoyl-L-alanine amidase [Maridesulfovibrio ferrireducens]